MRTTLYFSVSVQLEQTRLHLNHSEKAFDSYLEYFYSLPPIAKIINLQPKIYICKMLICNNEPILPGNCIKIYTVIKKVIHFEFDYHLSFSRFCPDFPENPDRCLSAVRILKEKFSVVCLSVRADKDEAEVSGLSVSLSADAWCNL